LTAPPRDPEVVRWLRRPLWWLLGVAVLSTLWVVQPVIDLITEARIERDGVPVAGTILGSWDGGQRVPVSFTPPAGGEPVTAVAWGPVDHERPIGPIDLQVDPDDPSRVRVAGSLAVWPVVEALTLFVPILLALLIWLVTRHRCVRRSERLAAADLPAYRMVGVPVPGRFARRRWRMHLYPLDVGAGTSPVCTVPVIGWSDSTASRTVEVKGEPRPGGAVVISDRALDRIWWPAGRSLVTGQTPLPEPGAPAADLGGRTRWWLVVLGGFLIAYALAGGPGSQALEEQAGSTTATVVEGHGTGVEPTPVRYRVDGQDHEASPSLAGPQAAGDHVTLAYDPESPDHVWQAGTHEEIPGAQAPDSVLALFLGGVLLALGIVLAPPPMPERRPGERGGGLLPLR